MSNHIHVILRNRPDVVARWSDREVALRWLKVFPGRRIEEHLAEPTENDVQTVVRNKQKLACIRRRRADISRLMRSLAEPIARMANRQDECTGRFWEGRFKAQRLKPAKAKSPARRGFAASKDSPASRRPCALALKMFPGSRARN